MCIGTIKEILTKISLSYQRILPRFYLFNLEFSRCDLVMTCHSARDTQWKKGFHIKTGWYAARIIVTLLKTT